MSRGGRFLAAQRGVFQREQIELPKRTCSAGSHAAARVVSTDMDSATRKVLKHFECSACGSCWTDQVA
jgi:hypothetical protein